MALKHLAAWAVFILYEVSFARFTAGRFSPVAHYFYYYALNIGLFYFNAHVLLELKSRFIALLLFAETAAYLGLKYLMDQAIGYPAGTYQTLLVPNIYRGVYFIGCSSLYWSVRRFFRAETSRLVILRQKAEIEKNLAEARNAYLQQQINPHFLFNTLNYIYNVYHACSAEAARCVLLLADIMRFSLEEVESNSKIPLAREIEQVTQLIELNRLRFDFPLYLDSQMEGDFEGQEVIPLILLTLTENIFKHGYLKNRDDPAQLSISISPENELRYYSYNLKKHQPSNRRLRSFGLQNVITRLDHSYPGRYRLDIQNEPDYYALTLIINL